MTKQELEGYLEVTLPSLRKKVLKTEIDNDILQETLVDIALRHDSLQASSAKQFMDLVECYFYRRTWVLNRRIHRAHRLKNYIGDTLLTEGGSRLIAAFPDNSDTQAVDPWNAVRTHALEYLELVQGVQLKRVMFKHYIEGYTLKEIALQEGISFVWAHKLLKQGVTQIKQFVQSM